MSPACDSLPLSSQGLGEAAAAVASLSERSRKPAWHRLRQPVCSSRWEKLLTSAAASRPKRDAVGDVAGRRCLAAKRTLLAAPPGAALVPLGTAATRP